ncbi:hypothetical protein Tco_0443537 [Tanacetum coccineum]
MKSSRKSIDLTANTPYYSRPIQRIQDFDGLKDHCLTLKNTSYPHQRYTVYNTLVYEEEQTSFTSIRSIHQEDTTYLCLRFIDNHEGLKTQYAEMDDLDITMEEYIQLMADKSHKRGHMFDWETATYGKIYDDIDIFKDFEADLPAIVYNDALAFDPKVSSEPTVSPHNAIKADFEFTISFSEFDDKDYTFIYDKNSYSYKLISVNDLKSDTCNDIDEINVKLPSEDISIKPLDSVINVNVDIYS